MLKDQNEIDTYFRDKSCQGSRKQSMVTAINDDPVPEYSARVR
jgi:hypothetical protein